MASKNPKNLADYDLTIQPPKKGKGTIQMKRPVDKRMFNCERGCLMLLVGLPGAGKCLTGDVEVSLANGTTRKIKNIKKNDSVLSFHKVKGFINTRVNHVIDNGIKPIFKTYFTDGKCITSTNNHRFLTDNGWKELSNINIGGLILNHSGNYSEVEKIVYIGKRQVYDLNVPETANFFANGLCVHNSTCILNLLAGENFLKYYYDVIHFIGATIEFDPTLKPLTEFYGNCHSDCSDSIIQGIMNSQLEQDPEERTNCAIIIDDALSLPSFKSRKDTTLSRLFGIHRHVTRGFLPTKENGFKSGGGGLIILSTQRLWGSTPPNSRACADAIIIGRTANEEQLGRTAKEYGGMFGGEQQLREMIQYCFKNEDHGFLCLYIAGDMDPESRGPVAYKSWSEKIFPTKRFPAREINLTDEPINESK